MRHLLHSLFRTKKHTPRTKLEPIPWEHIRQNSLFNFCVGVNQLIVDEKCEISYNTGGILFSPEKAVEEVSHVLKTTF